MVVPPDAVAVPVHEGVLLEAVAPPVGPLVIVTVGFAAE
jgi:hypothetical protein